MIVSKFGGTSMGTIEAMRRSARLCYRQKSRLVIVSATSGTTNQLLKIMECAEGNRPEPMRAEVKALTERHLQMARELYLEGEALLALKEYLEELKTLGEGMLLLGEVSPRAKDRMLGMGELLSSRLFQKALQDQWGEFETVSWYDIRDVMITSNEHNRALPLLERIKEQSEKRLIPLLKNKILVAQGFIGKTLTGLPTTLGRGGSDYSAALIAEAIESECLEIWTDVEGILSTDPRVVSGARAINEISYGEASEMAFFGAKVLHPTTLWPVMRKEIPVFVGSSFHEENRGTWIRSSSHQRPLVTGLALKKDQTLVTVTQPRMLHQFGFLSSLFQLFTKYQLSIDAVTTSEISVAFTLDETPRNNPELYRELKELGRVEIENDLQLISIIGNDLHQTKGIGAQIFNFLTDVNVRMVCHGASRHHFCVLVDKEHAEKALQTLHAGLIENREDQCTSPS